MFYEISQFKSFKIFLTHEIFNSDIKSVNYVKISQVVNTKCKPFNIYQFARFTAILNFVYGV